VEWLKVKTLSSSLQYSKKKKKKIKEAEQTRLEFIPPAHPSTQNVFALGSPRRLV
jgi:hypothetical protein